MDLLWKSVILVLKRSHSQSFYSSSVQRQTGKFQFSFSGPKFWLRRWAWPLLPAATCRFFHSLSRNSWALLWSEGTESSSWARSPSFQSRTAQNTTWFSDRMRWAYSTSGSSALDRKLSNVDAISDERVQGHQGSDSNSLPTQKTRRTGTCMMPTTHLLTSPFSALLF